MIWLDVTTSLGWSRPPVGIVRTELECARHVLRSIGQENARLCYFDKVNGSFRVLSNTQVRKIENLLDGRYSEISGSRRQDSFFVTIKHGEARRSNFLRVFNKSLIYSLDPVETGFIRGWVFHQQFPNERLDVIFQNHGIVVKKVRASEFRPDLLAAKLGTGECAFSLHVGELAALLESNGTQQFSIFVEGVHTPKTHIGSITFDKTNFDGRDYMKPDGGSVVEFADGDVYLTGGLDWDNKDLNRIYELKTKNNFKFVGFCYDLIPFYFPHLCVGDVTAFFASYFTNLSWCADGVLCISEHSQRDYETFVSLSGSELPKTTVIRLGSSIVTRHGEIERGRFENLIKQKYILFVSTVERRKNHDVLYKAYVSLIERGVENLPKLIFVGMRGWGTGDIINDISLDPRVKDLIHLYDDVADDELSLLYRNCLFTVFPSLYEGWGLPVAESLAYGKYCLASGRASIPEVAGNLIEYLDTWDVRGWADKIHELVCDKTVLQAKEKAIRERFQIDSWKSCTSDIFDFVNEVGDDRMSASPAEPGKTA